ncbi:MAG TPA: DUF3826 domain-containing protein [Tepidisphaeraceae bacterium]|jgi:hypothetical protein|nr:DUF3826 domain-containing protein [Tepidisphaeraceae bacterium]
MSRIKTHLVAALAAFLLIGGIAQAAPTTAPADDADARYTATIEKRVNDILALLKIDDAAKHATVHDIIIAQYRTLNDWQKVNQPKLKDKSTTPEQKQAILATRQPIHDKFISQLNEQLTPEQVEIVKDKMTYNTVEVTYKAYLQFVPQLTDVQKTKILETLKAGREEAMDGSSQEEKATIFKKYKGKIANYLSAQGIDIKKQTKEYMDAQKAKRATTEPAQ